MTETSTRKLAVVLAAVGLLGSFAVAGTPVGQLAAIQQADDQPATQETTYLRVVHASPDAPPVDVYVEDEPVLENVSFGDASEYLQLAAGSYNVTITAAGNESAEVFDGTVELPARRALTLAAIGEVGNASDGADNATGGVDNASNATAFQPVLYVDDALAPAENESAISVAHFVPDAPAVDVTVTDNGTTTVLADDVSYGNVSEYATVPAGNHTLEIRQETEGNNGSVVATLDVSLEGGAAYSAFAIGYLEPDEPPADSPFQVVVTEDATTTIDVPSEGTPTPTATGTPAETPTETESPTDTEMPGETPTDTEMPGETPTESPAATETPTQAIDTPAGTPTDEDSEE